MEENALKFFLTAIGIVVVLFVAGFATALWVISHDPNASTIKMLEQRGAHVARWSGLFPSEGPQGISFGGRHIGDRGLQEIIPILQSLPPEYRRYLMLADTNITDEGIKELSAIDGLMVLDLNNNRQITDQGVCLLLEFPSLSKVWLTGTNVSADGLRLLDEKGILYEKHF